MFGLTATLGVYVLATAAYGRLTHAAGAHCVPGVAGPAWHGRFARHRAGRAGQLGGLRGVVAVAWAWRPIGDEEAVAAAA